MISFCSLFLGLTIYFLSDYFPIRNMKRKNKKTQKTKEKTPTNSTESDKTGSEKEQSRKSIKTESFEQEANNIDADIENSSNSNKTDEMSSDLNGTESIKLEKTDDSQSSGSYAAEEKKSFSDSNSMCDMTNVDETFLFVELKLISIEQSCLNYKKLTQKFLCINSNALVDHLKKLIVKKMSLPGEFYEVIETFFIKLDKAL